MSDEQYTPKKADDSRLDLRAEQKVQKNRTPDLLRLNRRAVIFLGLQTIAFILYYISGNTQYFLEESMKIVLWAMTISAIALSLFCAVGIAESVFYAVRYKAPRLFFKLIPYSIIFFVSLAFAIFARTVDLLSSGY